MRPRLVGARISSQGYDARQRMRAVAPGADASPPGPVARRALGRTIRSQLPEHHAHPRPSSRSPARGEGMHGDAVAANEQSTAVAAPTRASGIDPGRSRREDDERHLESVEDAPPLG